MLERLPEYIDPLHLADKRGALQGQIAISDLTRLADALFDDTGHVNVELFFGREGRLAKIEGRIEALLVLKCQSCLQAMEWSINEPVKLGIVTSIELANRLPEEYAPLLVTEEKILLKSIVEDELLLSLPDYPKHQHSCLAAQTNTNQKADVVANGKPSSPENPFSILANLKNTGDL